MLFSNLHVVLHLLCLVGAKPTSSSIGKTDRRTCANVHSGIEVTQMSLGIVAYVHMGIFRNFNTHSNIKKTENKMRGKQQEGEGGKCLHRNGRMALALTYHKFVNIKSNVNIRRRRGGGCRINEVYTK